MNLEFAKIESQIDPELLNPLVWAYIGDAVFELYIRANLVAKGPSKINELHSASVKYVKASAQANFIRSISEELTEEELRIVKRGRNTKSSVPKNADVSDYRYSTGLEGLIGYLYLQDNKERLMEILQKLEMEE